MKRKLARDEVDILLISPERLANEHFRAEVLGPIAGRISLLVVDEAHCISDWGHDFRPHYRFIERIVRLMPPNLRLLATTATANNRVLEDLQNVLGPNLTVSRGDLSRSSLLLQTMRMPSQAERMAWLATHLPRINGSGIVYTLTVRDAEQVAEWLRTRGINAEAYSSETGERRVELENALLDNRVKALVATTSLGMGFDKPDLAFVIHYQTPGSVVGYYQQVGRAGRAIAGAYGILLSGEEETEITDYFIESAFPTPEEVRRVIDALSHAPNGLSVNELMSCVNVSFTAHCKDAASPFTRIACAYREAEDEVATHGSDVGQNILGTRRSSDCAPTHRAAANAGVRQFEERSHGVPYPRVGWRSWRISSA